ncbi:OmpH family outer membrane protein [Sphingomonas sp. dw_22]|uniref:OmpH family outer membrane protein n=1 Tax=Sphingomonas sp. dw_22 TaxID=2721175 RepID=UPI001BD5CD7F|nr:OmpH family outer membrane protein [Sphingomonas sp. dw_22]
MRTFLFLAIAASLAGPSQAQTPPAPSANTLGGPAVAGVCLLSRQDVFAKSKVGMAAADRLRILADDAQKELETERAPVEADVQKYNTEQAKLTPAQRQERQKALADRIRPIDDKTRQRQSEIEATRAKALQRISADVEPVLAQVYKQRNCGLLVDRNSVLGGNMANDLTDAVVQGLDAKVSTITFDRETLASAPSATWTPGSN